MRLLATDEANCDTLVRRVISDIVRQSSFQQTITSALAAGINKSIKYALAKVRKKIKSVSAGG